MKARPIRHHPRWAAVNQPVIVRTGPLAGCCGVVSEILQLGYLRVEVEKPAGARYRLLRVVCTAAELESAIPRGAQS